MLQHGWALQAKSSRHRIANTTEIYSQAGSRLAIETGGGEEERRRGGRIVQWIQSYSASGMMRKFWEKLHNIMNALCGQQMAKFDILIQKLFTKVPGGRSERDVNLLL